MKNRKDYYYRLAKKRGYRSRAAFKLLQINRTFRLIKKSDFVLDLGASPGGWSQVAIELGARVVAVDLIPMEKIEGVKFILGDIRSNKTLEMIKKVRDKYDVVISDASPKITGKWDIDHLKSIELAEASFKIAKEVLKFNGNFLVKVFQGREIKNFFNKLKIYFKFKKFHTPKASRKRSSEVYFIGKGFKRSKFDPNTHFKK